MTSTAPRVAPRYTAMQPTQVKRTTIFREAEHAPASRI